MSDHFKTALLAIAAFSLAIPVGAYVFKPAANSDHVSVSIPSDATPKNGSTFDELPDVLSLDRWELVALLERLDASGLRKTIRQLRSSDLTNVDRQSALGLALDALAAKDPAHFFSWIEESGISFGLATSAIETAAALLAKGDPEESFEVLKGLQLFRFQSVAWQAYGAVLAETDPKTAAEQMLAVNRGYEAGQVVGSVWAANDPAKASDFFAALRSENNVTMQVGMNQIMHRWAIDDPQAAYEWLRQEPDAFVRRLSTNRFFQRLAENPDTAELALQYISKTPSASNRNMRYRFLGQNLARQGTIDSDLLAKAIETAEPFERENMMAGMTGVMPPEIAKEVINSLDGQTHRSRAIGTAVKAFPSLDEGLQFASSLDTPIDRVNARFELVRKYAETDPATAMKAAAASEFPREQARHVNTLGQTLFRTAREGLVQDYSWIKSLGRSQRLELRNAVQARAEEKSTKMPESLSKAFED